MRAWLLAFSLASAAVPWGCSSDDESSHGEEAHGEGEEGHGHGENAVAITHFTEHTELFVEFAPLVVGQESAFAAHVTRLSDFQPVDVGRMVVTLSGGGSAEESFEISEPTIPGIFRPVAVPRHAGTRRLTLRLVSDALTDAHELGEVTVFTDADAAAHAAEDEEEGSGISFLKEQQWRIDFATAEVGVRELRPSLSASGAIRARSDGEVHVTAPAAGRLVTAGEAFPRIGQQVEENQVLVALAPRLGGEADVATLQLAVQQARLDVERSRRERERLDALLGQGAVPERRAQGARGDEEQAQAQLTAAQSRLSQYGRSVRSSASGSAGGLRIRAPLAGTIVAVDVTPGTFLDEGAAMFHIVNLERLWLEARIPEANIGRIQEASGAWFEIEGFDEVFEVSGERAVTTGGVVDARARTIQLIFEIDNPQRRLRVGMFARVHVLTGNPVTAAAVPLSAIVDDGGQEVVYVEVEGETFERRTVRLGVRDGGFVEVTQGLHVGERVVVLGALAVKLAASGTAVPEHGHAH